MIVKYIKGEKKLRLECPRAGKKLLSSYLTRLQGGPGGETVKLALWVPGKGESEHVRVEVDNSDRQGLVAELSHVSCYDNGIYVCENNVDGLGKIKVNHSFTYTEDATVPHITQTPLLSRYDINDTLHLKCSAGLGTRDNGLIWEIQREGAPQFVPLSPGSFPGAVMSAEDGNQVQTNNCMVTGTLQLRYRLTAGDDAAVLRCRLSKTGNSSQIIVALSCPGPRDPAGRTSTSGEGANVKTTGRPAMAENVGADDARAQHVKAKDGRADSGAESDPTLVIVVTAVAGVLGATLVVVLLLVRRWRRQQMRPLVVMETPESSVYGGGRRLPDIPTFSLLHHGGFSPDHHPPPHTNLSTTLSRSLSTSGRYVDSPLSSALPAAPLEDPNVSVYISMTGLDSLQSAKDGGMPPRKDHQNPATDDPASFVSEYDNMDPQMTPERSESIYSNQGRNVRPGTVNNITTTSTGSGSNNNNNHRNIDDEEVTRLKIVD